MRIDCHANKPHCSAFQRELSECLLLILLIKLALVLSLVPMLLLRKQPRQQRWFMLSVLWSGVTLLALALVEPRLHDVVHVLYFGVLLLLGVFGWRYRGRLI